MLLSSMSGGDIPMIDETQLTDDSRPTFICRWTFAKDIGVLAKTSAAGAGDEYAQGGGSMSGRKS
ncbi:MAG: hypothetical protein ACLRV7_00520 [Hoylesella buccalis]